MMLYIYIFLTINKQNKKIPFQTKLKAAANIASYGGKNVTIVKRRSESAEIALKGVSSTDYNDFRGTVLSPLFDNDEEVDDDDKKLID